MAGDAGRKQKRYAKKRVLRLNYIRKSETTLFVRHQPSRRSRTFASYLKVTPVIHGDDGRDAQMYGLAERTNGAYGKAGVES